MNLLMADRAVLILRQAKVVERGRHNAGLAVHCHRQIGMAFQTDQPHLVRASACADWPSRAAHGSRASFIPHRGVLKSKRAALIAVAFHAARLVCSEGLPHGAAARNRADCGNPRTSWRSPGILWPIRLLKLRHYLKWHPEQSLLTCSGVRAARPTGPFA